MNDNCGIVGGGLKCDNPDCDFVDMSIEIDDYDKWLNVPCPKCGANLLTQEDYDAVKMILLITKLAQALPIEVEDKTTATVRFDGTGKVKFEIDKNK